MSWRAKPRPHLQKYWDEAVAEIKKLEPSNVIPGLQVELDKLVRLSISHDVLDGTTASTDLAQIFKLLHTAAYKSDDPAPGISEASPPDHAAPWSQESGEDSTPLMHTCIVTLCRLLRQLLTAKLFQPQQQLLTSIFHYLLDFALETTPSCTIPPTHPGSPPSVESLRVMADLIDSHYLNIDQCARTLAETRFLLAFSSSQTKQPDVPPTVPPLEAKFSPPQLQVPTEKQKRIAHILELLVTKYPTHLPPAWSIECLALATKQLHAVAAAPASQLPDEWHASYYTNLIKLLASLIPITGTAFVKDDALLVDTLVRYMGYAWPIDTRPQVPSRTKPPQTCTPQRVSSFGTSNGSPSPSLYNTPSRSGRYVPPSERRPGDSSAESSATEASDSDASGNSASTHATRVRLAATHCLLAMLKQNASALHSLWDRLLPHANPIDTSRRPPTLLTILLHDPHTKSRTAAALALTMMLEDRKSKAFLGVAEVDTRPRGPSRVRAFTSLSSSLGAMLTSLHAGLAHSLKQENRNEVLLQVLRAATALAEHTPYHRLPAQTLDPVVAAAVARWCASGSITSPPTTVPARTDSSADRSQIACSVLSLLTTAINSTTMLTHTKIMTYTSTAPPPPRLPASRPTSATPPAFLPDLLPLLLTTAQHASAAEQWEALAVLRALCQHHFTIVSPHWDSVLALANAHMQIVRSVEQPQGTTESRARPSRRSSQSGEAANSSTVVEKAANQALRLAADFVKHAYVRVGGAAGDAGDVGGRACSSSAGSNGGIVRSGSAVEREVFGGNCLRCTGGDKEEPSEMGTLIVRAQALLSNVLMLSMESAAAPIRAAAYAASTALPVDLLVALPTECMSRLVAAACQAVMSDPVAAVRRNAVNIVQAVLDHSTFILGRRSECSAAILALKVAAVDPVVSVRLSSSAAVAGLCVHILSLTGQTTGDERDNDLPAPPPTSIAVTSTDTQDHMSDTPVSQVLEPEAWSALRVVTLAAAKDTDKLRVNGMRAVGCLFALMPVDRVWLRASAAAAIELERRTEQHQDDIVQPDATLMEDQKGMEGGGSQNGEWLEWADSAAVTVHSCMKVGNAKTSWNACVAASRLLSNATLMDDAHLQRPSFAALILSLVSLLQHSSNYKVRAHAANALMAPRDPSAFGSLYVDVVRAVHSALQKLHAPVDGDDGADGVGAEVMGPNSRDGAFPNFKYHAALSAQLMEGVLHFVAHLKGGHVEALSSELESTVELLESKMNLDLRSLSAQPAVILTKDMTAVDDVLSLPADPFGQSAERVARGMGDEASAWVDKQAVFDVGTIQKAWTSLGAIEPALVGVKLALQESGTKPGLLERVTKMHSHMLDAQYNV